MAKRKNNVYRNINIIFFITNSILLSYIYFKKSINLGGENQNNDKTFSYINPLFSNQFNTKKEKTQEEKKLENISLTEEMDEDLNIKLKKIFVTLTKVVEVQSLHYDRAKKQIENLWQRGKMTETKKKDSLNNLKNQNDIYKAFKNNIIENNILQQFNAKPKEIKVLNDWIIAFEQLFGSKNEFEKLSSENNYNLDADDIKIMKEMCKTTSLDKCDVPCTKQSNQCSFGEKRNKSLYDLFT